MPAELRNPERSERAEHESPFAGPVLLVVDACETTVRAAQRAAEFAAAFKTRVVAVSVVDTETLECLLRGNILVRDEMEEFERDLGESARRYLHMACAVVEDAGVSCEETITSGSWHQAVVTKQREIKAGLVVIGGFTYTMVKRDVTARAKQMIIDEVACPVLIVR
jgi:nucleotide-binding universal stress UspA family protein